MSDSVPAVYHVLTRDGDATAEVEEAIRTSGGVTAAGLHRFFYVSRAQQTVVLTESPEAPLARTLRALPGWREPGDAVLH